MKVEHVDTESFREYSQDVGYWKHQCMILSDFNYNNFTQMWQNATMEEITNLIRGRYHYYNSGDE